jgi:diguanylate cyclase (GGDEF)-like protein
VAGYSLLSYAAYLQAKWQPNYANLVAQLTWRQLIPLALLPFVVAWLYGMRFAGTQDIPTVGFAVLFALLVVLRQSISFTDALSLNQRLAIANESLQTARATLQEHNDLLLLDLLEEQERASSDALTGLPNRRAITEELATLLAGSHTTTCAVGMVDMDHLKTINDRFGHAAGDETLISVSAALQSQRSIAGRVGGDEFVVLMPNAAAAAVEHYTQRVNSLLALSSVRYEGLQLSVSFGFAFYPAEAKTPAELLKLADLRMYDEKHGQEVRGQGCAGRLDTTHFVQMKRPPATAVAS